MGYKRGLIFVILIISILFIGGCCPPAMFPQPPGCVAGKLEGVTKGSKDERGCFPPTCSMIPDPRGQYICEQFRAGADITNWPSNCADMPFTCKNLCDAEKKRYHDTGLKNWENGIKNNVNWYKEPYTQVFVFGSVTEHYEGVEKADARAWGAVSVDDGRIQAEADLNHYWNMPWISRQSYGAISFIDPTDKSEIPIYSKDLLPFGVDKAIRKDLEGNELRIDQQGRTTLLGREGYSLNGLVPELRQELINRFKRTIDFGADGIVLDDAQVMTDIKSLKLYFDDYTVSQFTEFLKQRFTEEDWKKIGADPATFNYKDYLKSKGFASSSFDEQNAKDKVPLVLLFREFIVEANRMSMKQIFDDVRAYAESKGRKITVSANLAGYWVGSAYIEQYLDYATFEYGFIENNPPYNYVAVAPFAKFSGVRGKDTINLIVASNYQPMDNLFKSNPEAHYDVTRLAIMDSYASKTSNIFLKTKTTNMIARGDANEQFRQIMDASDSKEANKAYSFMRKYKEYYQNYGETNAKVAIIYSNEYALRLIRENPDDGYFWKSVYISKGLYASAIDYDVVDFTNNLQKYSVAVLAKIDKVSDKDADALLNFASGGGTLIVLGTPEGKLKNIKSGAYGKGKIEALGGDDESKVPVLIKSFVAGINTADTLPAISYNNNGNYVVHLFTPDRASLNGFKERTNIRVELPFDISGYKVYYASLENPEKVELDSSNILLPSLKTYGLLMITK